MNAKYNKVSNIMKHFFSIFSMLQFLIFLKDIFDFTVTMYFFNFKVVFRLFVYLEKLRINFSTTHF